MSKISTTPNKTNNNMSSQYSFQPIQPQQAVAQLKLLGYGVGDVVYLRMIDPRRLDQEQKRELKRYPVQAELRIVSENEQGVWDCIYTPWDKWEQTEQLKADGTPKAVLVANPARSTHNWSQAIEKLNRSGYGVYFSINKGGTKAEDIKSFTAAFFESDEGTHESQWDAIRSFSLEPTMVVATRKSLHTYFTLKKNTLTAEEWTHDIQHPLIMAMGSDPAIEDPSRIMRLAGFNHAKWNQNTNQWEFVLCQLHLSDSQPQYTVEEVKAAAAQQLPLDCSHERWTLWKRLQGTAIHYVQETAKALGFDYAAEREKVKVMNFDDIELYARRYNKFHQLCLNKSKGSDVDPMSAWEEKAAKLPKANLKKVRYEQSEIYSDGELGDADTIRWAQYLYGYNPNGRPGWITAQCPSVPEEKRGEHSIDSLHINKTTGAIKSQRGEDAKVVYRLMREAYEKATEAEFQAEQSVVDNAGKTVWDRLSGCDRKPDIIVNQRYLDPIDTEPGNVYIIKSAKGTGKTVAAKTLVGRFPYVQSIYTRIAQAEEQAPRIGCEFKNKPNWKSPENKVAYVLNSMPNHDPGKLAEGGLLLGDEFNQIPDHLLGDTVNDRRQVIYSLLENAFAAIAGGGTGVFMSADIKNRDIQLIEALAKNAGVKKVIYIENQYQVNKGCLHVLGGDNIFGAINIAVEKLNQGKHIMIGTDVKNGTNGANTLHEHLQALFPEKKGMVVTGDNSGEPFVKNFLANINEFSTDLDWLIASPAITNGVSIDNGHFQVTFGLYHGILTVDDATQQLDRVRNSPEVYLWAAQTGCGSSGYSLTPAHVRETVKANYREYTELMAELMVEHKYVNCEHQLESPWFDHYCQAVAYRNQCMIGYRDKIIQKALQDGFESYEMLEVTEDTKTEAKATQSAVRDCAERLEVAEAKEVEAGEVLSFGELESLMLEDRKTKQQRANIAKTWLLRNYGEEMVAKVQVEKAGELVTGIAAMHIRDKKENLHRGLERLRFLHLANGEELAKNKDLATEGYDFKHKEFTTNRSIQNIKYYSLQLRLLKKLKVDQFIDPTRTFSEADTKALFTAAKKESEKVGSLLNLKVASYKHHSQFFSVLMGSLGLQLKQSRVNDKRVYKITEESWELFQLYLAHKDTASATQSATTAIKQTDNAMQAKMDGVTGVSPAALRKLTAEYITTLRQKCSDMTESALEAAAEAFTSRYRNLCHA